MKVLSVVIVSMSTECMRHVSSVVLQERDGGKTVLEDRGSIAG